MGMKSKINRQAKYQIAYAFGVVLGLGLLNVDAFIGLMFIALSIFGSFLSFIMPEEQRPKYR